MRIVLRSHDGRAARPLRERLEAIDLPATTLAGVAAVRPAPEGEDVTILDASDPGEAIAFAQSLRARACPSLSLVGAARAPPTREQAPLLDAWLDLFAPPESAVRRMQSIFRDGVMTAEADARRRTAAALGLPAKAVDDEPSRAPRALFVGAPTALFLPFQSAFARRGGQACATFTSFSAFDHLHDEAFDALVLHGGDDPSATLSLIAALRRNSRLYDMPAFVFAPDEETRIAGLARGADAALSGEADIEDAAGWLAEDIRRARIRRALARRLEAPMSTAADSFVFYGYHLAGLAQTHHDHGRPLSIAVLRIGAVNPVDPETWRRGFTEIAGLSARLVRATDCAAIIDQDRLAFAFPSTALAGAQAALKRIIGVCECTAFAAGDNGGGPLTFAARAAELSPGESGAGLLARALRYKAA